MLHHLHHHKKPWDPELVEYYIYKFLIQIGYALLSVFVPIYLFAELGYSILEVILFYLINQIFFLVFVPFAGKVVKKIGIKHAMLLQIPGFALFAYLLRFLTGDFRADLWLIIGILAIRAIPKTPYLTAETIFISRHVMKDRKNEGKALASVRIVLILTSIISPLIGGLITKSFGFEAFFNVALIILLTAGIPLLMTKDEYFELKESPAEIVDFTLKKLPRNFKMAEFGRWMPDAVMWLLWPLFIYIVLKDVSQVGTIVSISSMIAMGMSYYVGKRIDQTSPKKLLSKSTKLASGVYFFRSLFPTPLMLIATDAINQIVSPALMIPYEKYYYDFVKSNKNLIEVSVAGSLLLEFIFAIGFILFALYFGLLELLSIPITYTSFIVIFVFYGCFMLLMNRIAEVKTIN